MAQRCEDEVPKLQGLCADCAEVVLKSARKDDANLAREIHHHRQFLHPHIARLYEVIVTESLVWLALEYCPGTNTTRRWTKKHANKVCRKVTSSTTIFSTTALFRFPKLRKFSLSLSELSPIYITNLVCIEI